MTEKINFIQINLPKVTGSEVRVVDGVMYIDLHYEDDCGLKIGKSKIDCDKEMATLTIPFSSISNPIPLVGGGYRYIVQFLDSSGNLISSPNLTQNQAVTINSPTLPQSLAVNVAGGTWSLSDVTIRVWSDHINSGCYADFTQDLVATCATACSVSIQGVTQACVNSLVQFTVNASTTAPGGLQYGIVAGVTANQPTSWQSSNVFGSLPNNSPYTVWARNAANNGCIQSLSVTSNVPNCTVAKPNCGCNGPNFTIASVTYVSGSTYALTFDACAVNPLDWSVDNGLKTGSVVPTTGTVNIDLSGVPNGSHTIKVTSTGCNGEATFTFNVVHNGGGGEPPVPSTSPIQFIENGTGNSVDFNQVNGISPGYVGQFQRFAQNGVDVIRLVFQAGDYNPIAGVYRNSKLTDAINWVRALPGSPKVDLLFVPIFKLTDSRFDDSQLHADSSGNKADCTFALNKYPSFYSSVATAVLNSIYDNLIPYLVANHSGDINDLSFAAGTSEEHYMAYTANYPGGPGCGGGYGGIGDYSAPAQAAFKLWLKGKYPTGNIPYQVNGQTVTWETATIPHIPVASGNNYNADFNQPVYREVMRFWNEGTFQLWKRFRDKVKQHSNFRVEYFVADMFNDQGIRWTMNAGTMFKAMKLCDVWYHTDNISPSNWGRILVGTDIVKGGSFTNTIASAIEFDSTDAGNPSGGPINVEHVKAAIIKFIEHGGTKIHWALGWTNSQIDQLGEVMAYVKAYINQPGWSPRYVTARPSALIINLNTHDMFFSSAYIDTAWQSTGNSLSNPAAANIVNIRVTNNGSEDTFWTTPNP